MAKNTIFPPFPQPRGRPVFAPVSKLPRVVALDVVPPSKLGRERPTGDPIPLVNVYIANWKMASENVDFPSGKG